VPDDNPGCVGPFPFGFAQDRHSPPHPLVKVAPLWHWVGDNSVPSLSLRFGPPLRFAYGRAGYYLVLWFMMAQRDGAW
jgi:hypothetical protein